MFNLTLQTRVGLRRGPVATFVTGAIPHRAPNVLRTSSYRRRVRTRFPGVGDIDDSVAFAEEEDQDDDPSDAPGGKTWRQRQEEEAAILNKQRPARVFQAISNAAVALEWAEFERNSFLAWLTQRVNEEAKCTCCPSVHITRTIPVRVYHMGLCGMV